MQRPFMIVEPSWSGEVLTNLTFRNIGNSPAINVQIIAGPRRIKFPIFETTDGISIGVRGDSVIPSAVTEITLHTVINWDKAPYSLLIDLVSLSHGLELKIEYSNIALNPYFAIFSILPTGALMKKTGSVISDLLPSNPVIHT
jgi:hypothetical protein